MSDIREKLLEKLIEYGRIDSNLSPEQKKKEKEHFACETVAVKNYNILKVRDSIIGLGTILEENIDEQFYIATIKIGFIGAYEAVAIVCLDKDVISIAAYAKEGLISQNNAQKAIDKIKKRIK